MTNVESELSSSKNCETVIPNAVQIRSMEGKVGNIPFLYQEEIVDELPPHTRDFSRELGGFYCIYL